MLLVSSVTMILRNNFPNDDRVKKEVETLASKFEIRIMHTGTKKDERLMPIYFPKKRFLAIPYYPIYILLLSLKAISAKADIYHCHDLDTLLAGYIASRIRKAKLVYDSHEVFTEMPGIASMTKPFWKILEKMLINKSDLFITTNKYRMDFFKRKYKVKKTFILENLPKRKKPFKKIFGENVIFLYQGAISSKRGIDNLFKAFLELPEDKAELIVVGSFEKSDVEPVKNKNITLTGYIPLEEISRYEEKSDVGIAFYISQTVNTKYPSSNKVFRYLQNGMAIITSKSPCFKNLIKNKKYGIMLNPEKKEEIKEAMQWFIKNKKKVRESSKEKMKLINEDYTWEEQEKEFLRIYEQIIE